MECLKDLWARLKWSWRTLTIQVTAFWSAIWLAYSQLPADVMIQLSQHKVWLFNVPAWIAIAQAISTNWARVKKQPNLPPQ